MPVKRTITGVLWDASVPSSISLWAHQAWPSHERIDHERLGAAGFAVLPVPQEAQWEGGWLRLPFVWRLTHNDLGADDACLPALEDAWAGAGCMRREDGTGVAVVLRRTPDVAFPELSCEVAGQGYELGIGAGQIEIRARTAAGLFYGVQTLVQLVETADVAGGLPLGTIRDWPAYPLRFVHWDTKHHQDRIETLRRYLDWMARFKLNAVSFEIEDKFEFPSHPEIGAPGAFTTAELQALTAYARARHIHLVPNLQAPAHMTFVLKHPAFAHLRCDGSNYQACLEDPAARALIFDLYADLCRATPGVPFFHVSTDEVYYAGICERQRPYTPGNRSLALVEFINAAHDRLAAEGRRILIWGEYPLLPAHVPLLAPDIINGLLYSAPGYVDAENAHGIRQLVYVPIQGDELVFPKTLPRLDRNGQPLAGRLNHIHEAHLDPRTLQARPVGVFAAAWDDAGLHNECFWPGWAAMAQKGWTPGRGGVSETLRDFAILYLGRPAAGMESVYHDLQEAARFFEQSWDKCSSRVRGAAYGNSKGKRPIQRMDLTIDLPDPDGGREYRANHAELFAGLEEARTRLDRLDARVERLLGETRRNGYHLEVLRSLAGFLRHHADLLAALGEAGDRLVAAAAARRAGNHDAAALGVRQARQVVAPVVADRAAMLARLQTVWEKSRWPRGRTVGGRAFLHVMDDVKDHFADRRPDLSYLTAPEEGLGLDEWLQRLDTETRNCPP